LNLDFVFIDTEHIALDRHQLSWMCQTYKALNICPIVRIPKPDAALACTVLDGGACGLVAPYLETVEQVTELRGAVKLRPLKGKRLEDKLKGGKSFDIDDTVTDAFIEKNNEDNLLIVNIESIPAIENLENILKVPGVDAVLVGPHDLSVNLGIAEDWKNPKFDEAVKTIINKSRKAGVGVGIHHSFGIMQEISWIKYGANMIVHASDLVAFREKMTEDFKTIRESV